MKLRNSRLPILFAGLFVAFSMVAMDHADARRGGSFGSRGLRTFQAAPPTRTAPQPAAPVQRTTTRDARTANPASPAQATPQRPGFMNGLGGSMMRGLLLGGLLGMFLGYGFGGMAGLFGFLLQALLVGGAIMLALRFFRSRTAAAGATPALAGLPRGAGSFGRNDVSRPDANRAGSFTIPGFGSGSGTASNVATSSDIALDQADLDTFERTLTEVQEAFGREDHAALRRLTTPEMVSYLSEELAENAKKGQRNDVSDVKLLQADIAESWSEGDRDYATAALRYESRDVMHDRASGAVVSGDPDSPTETVELWTFTRPAGGDWKLSAIQETAG